MKWSYPAISLVGLSVLIVVGGLVYLLLPKSTTTEPVAIRLQPGNQEIVAQGAELYASECASCHGANLEGQSNWRQRLGNGRLAAPPHNETGHTWHHPDEALFNLTKFGPAALVGNGYESDMPGFETTLSDEEILAVLSYIKAQWPIEIRFRHDQMNAAQE